MITLPRAVLEQALLALRADDWPLVRESVVALSAALEQPKDHVPDIREMVPAGWKLVPVEPTEEMLRSGCRCESLAMLAVAPQPQGEQTPVAYGLFRKDTKEIDWDADHVFSNEPWGPMYDDEEVLPLYTSWQPKREQPLTNEEVLGVAKSIEIEFDVERLDQQIDDILVFARAIEAAHGITGEKK